MFKKFLSIIAVSVYFASAINLNNTVWNTNWNVMYFWQTGNSVSGEYMYDDGILTGTISGDTLRGWWREYNNAQTCGPSGTWSGPLVFLFSTDTSFTGDWAYCGTEPSSLNPNGTAWTGTIKEGATTYTQEECENGGRFWCDNKCLLAPCNQTVTKEICEASGRFWCTDSCVMVNCDQSSVRPEYNFSYPTLSDKQLILKETPDMAVDIRGRTVTGKHCGIIIIQNGQTSIRKIVNTGK